KACFLNVEPSMRCSRLKTRKKEWQRFLISETLTSKTLRTSYRLYRRPGFAALPLCGALHPGRLYPWAGSRSTHLWRGSEPPTKQWLDPWCWPGWNAYASDLGG